MSKETNKKQQSASKSKQKNSTYVIRFGRTSGDDTIFATVWLKTANAGFKYLTYSLSRRYTVGDVQKYSTDFYHYNSGAKNDVSSQASAFIKMHKDNPFGAIEAAKELNAKRFPNSKQPAETPVEIVETSPVAAIEAEAA